MNALERITVFMTLMRQLAGVMEEERRLLVELHLDSLGDVQADKAALIEAYEIELRRLRAEPETIARLSDPVRAELHATMQAFQRSLTHNIDCLIDARTRMSGLADTLDASLQKTAGPARIETRGNGVETGAAGGEIIRVAFGRERGARRR